MVIESITDDRKVLTEKIGQSCRARPMIQCCGLCDPISHDESNGTNISLSRNFLSCYTIVVLFDVGCCFDAHNTSPCFLFFLNSTLISLPRSESSLDFSAVVQI